VKKLLTITLVFVFALALVLAIGCAKKEQPAMEGGGTQGMQQSTTPDTSTTMPMDSTHMGGH